MGAQTKQKEGKVKAPPVALATVVCDLLNRLDSDEDTKKKREVVRDRIYQHLKQRYIDGEEEHKEIVKYSKQIEKSLYSSAPSLEAYADRSTFDDRLKSALLSYHSCSALPKSNWHPKNRHKKSRDEMFKLIYTVFKEKASADRRERDKNNNNNAYELEVLLFSSAPSFEAHIDASTLKARLEHGEMILRRGTRNKGKEPNDKQIRQYEPATIVQNHLSVL